MTHEEYSNTIQACRDRIRIAKAHLESNNLRNIKGKKGYYKYLSNKWKTREMQNCC